jgi:apolipoprotein D and lipocalin family protein
MQQFDIAKYLGVWYELMHYPSWFQRNDNYNTTAEYTLNGDGTLTVHNSTMTQGQRFDSYGTARSLGGTNFRVDFPMPEVAKLATSGEFKGGVVDTNPNSPNYIIEKIWVDAHDQYLFVVVTDPSRQSLYVLSRFRHPALSAYNALMTYVVKNFDRDRLVQTPHLDDQYR